MSQDNLLIFLLFWLILSLSISAAVLITKKRRNQPFPAPEQFVVAAFSLGAVTALINVLWKLFTVAELRKLLEWDGVVALCVGIFFGGYLAVREVIKLFQ